MPKRKTDAVHAPVCFLVDRALDLDQSHVITTKVKNEHGDDCHHDQQGITEYGANQGKRTKYPDDAKAGNTNERHKEPQGTSAAPLAFIQKRKKVLILKSKMSHA